MNCKKCGAKLAVVDSRVVDNKTIRKRVCKRDSDHIIYTIENPIDEIEYQILMTRYEKQRWINDNLRT